MSLTDWEKCQAIAATCRAHARTLGDRAFSDTGARLVEAFDAIADLAESADRLPSERRMVALFRILEEEIARIPE